MKYYYSILLPFFALIYHTTSLTSGDPSTPTKSITFEDYDTTLLPGRSVCGVVKESPKIYGGTAVEFGEFPWIVALEYKSISNEEPLKTLCAGSLINERYVLTSASCVKNPFRAPVNAILGEWKLSTNPDCVRSECADPIVKIKIQDLVHHKDYNSKLGENDIALIRLDKDVIYSDYISPICLPPRNLPFPQEDDLVTVAGWGKTEQGVVSDVLLKVNLPIASSEKCGQKLKRNISENNFCAGGEAGKDACQGDAGSFAIRVYGDEINQVRWYQHGIVSYGAGCGVAGYAGVFTKVDKYIDWIVTTIQKGRSL